MDALDHFSDILLTRLVWTSIQAGLLIGAVYLAAQEQRGRPLTNKELCKRVHG